MTFIPETGIQRSMVLEIEHLSQRYGNREILSISSFRINHGIYWIQGENGAGKSTLFRTLAGMLPFEGTVKLDGRYDLKKNPVDYRLKLNLGEAEPLYPAFLTPADLIAFVAEAQRASKEQCDSLTEAFGVHYLQNPFGSCSSGMVKKVSLLLAFLGEPSLIILDEPLITIDREAREVLFHLIRDYYKKGVTFLLSSHQLFEQEGLHVSQSFRLKDKTLVSADLP